MKDEDPFNDEDDDLNDMEDGFDLSKKYDWAASPAEEAAARADTTTSHSSINPYQDVVGGGTGHYQTPSNTPSPGESLTKSRDSS